MSWVRVPSPTPQKRGSGSPRSPVFLSIGASPSGKARDFDSLTRGFESRLPSQRPLGGGCDPLAQLAEHLTFNQGVRSSNLRWITSKFPLKSPILAILGDFFCHFPMNTFVRNFRCFTLLYDKMYTKMYTTPSQSFTKKGIRTIYIYALRCSFAIFVRNK